MNALLNSFACAFSARVGRARRSARAAWAWQPRRARSDAPYVWAVLFAFSVLVCPAARVPLPIIDRFETFGAADGIPADKVHAVFKTSEGVLWIGTWDGLCIREANGKF